MLFKLFVSSVLSAIVLLSLTSLVIAQDAVPIEILQRTFLIRAGDGATFGTAFEIDYKGKLYIVTARHVALGFPEKNATLQVLHAKQWQDRRTARTFFPASADVDIAVFETDEKAEKPFEISLPSATEGVTFGQQIWFLGYPWGMHSQLNEGETPFELPFIKRGTMSAIDGSNKKAVVLYVDGFNNPGFSGGPIVYWDFNSHGYRVIGVVKGYREDTAKTVVNGKHVDTEYLVNSGILIGYSIQHAVEAIEEGLKQTR